MQVRGIWVYDPFGSAQDKLSVDSAGGPATAGKLPSGCTIFTLPLVRLRRIPYFGVDSIGVERCWVVFARGRASFELEFVGG